MHTSFSHSPSPPPLPPQLFFSHFLSRIQTQIHRECQPFICFRFGPLSRLLQLITSPLRLVYDGWMHALITLQGHKPCVLTIKKKSIDDQDAGREGRKSLSGSAFSSIILLVSCCFLFSFLAASFSTRPFISTIATTHQQSRKIGSKKERLISLSNYIQSIHQSHQNPEIPPRINMMSSSSAAFSPDHLSPSDQLCYVQCNFCDTVLAVSVPSSILFKTVTVRCGHCSNLLSVNMRALLLPAANSLHLGHGFFNPPSILDEIRSATPPNLLINQPNPNESLIPFRGVEELPNPPVVNRPPEKRQRVPSAYNRFIKDEIQRIKAGNPDISHREAFSAAAKNWAHFPHIHFGLLPDQPVKKPNVRQQEGEDMIMKDGFFNAPANVGVAPY